MKENSARAGVAATRGAALGFFQGVRALFGGLWFVVTTPSTWGWAFIPVAAATLVFTLVGALALVLGNALAHDVVVSFVGGPPGVEAGGDGSGAWPVVLLWVLRLALAAVGLVLAFVVAMTLAQPLSGFALDVIARKQEVALGGRVWPEQPALAGALRSLRVSLAALAVGLPILGILAVITLLVPPLAIVTIPLKLVVTGVLAAYDLLDYPMSLRGLGVRARLTFIRANFSAVLGFGVAAAALLLVPGMGLLLLPFGVAGAARMVRARDVAGP